ncbi:TRAP transporter small permease subunit [Dongia deserti]|uniref:TRAP transporter small permease subunit n=1 Tax=Dongia deserti TaxID=2268030 RepID=UPI002548AA34|nr:TRAP transporter small permease subunit [Dongia deserti]
MIRSFIALSDGLSRVAGIVATLLLVAAMVVISEMIFLRYVFRAPTYWQTDFVVFSATAAIFLGAPYVLLHKGHVGVDVIEMLLADRARRRLRLVGAILGLLFSAAMLTTCAHYVHEAYVNGWKHSSIWAPRLWIPMLSMPVGFGLLCLQYVAEMLKLMVGAREDAAAAVEERHA